MINTIAAALLWLAPHLSPETADQYAKIVAFESRWYSIHPFVVLAIGHVESRWTARAVSPTNDYGLLQIHVGAKRSNRFYRRERELFDPRINIREGVRILAMWRRFHRRWCRARHPYWGHYKWGRKVKGKKYTRKVGRLYRILSRRYRLVHTRTRYAYVR